MKRNIALLALSITGIFAAKDLYASVRLTTPEDLKIEQLNKEQKEKFQNIDYTETLAIPNQYKGKLKYTEGKEEVHLKDVRLFFGAGGRYTFSGDTTLTSDLNENEVGSPGYFNKKNNLKFDDNFNFYASAGLYWRNGIRLEFEYSQMTLTTNNFGKNFKRYDNGIIFNQYLQRTGVLNTYGTGMNKYTALTNNMLPKLDFSVKTYMVNFIFEKTNIRSKIRPYIGFGAGLVEGDIETLKNDGASRVLGGQVMVGLSYPISEDQLVLYLGYRGIFSQKMEQTFTRITNVSLENVPSNISSEAFNGKTYYNPNMVQSKEKYDFQAHNIDFGIRFFF